MSNHTNPLQLRLIYSEPEKFEGRSNGTPTCWHIVAQAFVLVEIIKPAPYLLLICIGNMLEFVTLHKRFCSTAIMGDGRHV